MIQVSYSTKHYYKVAYMLAKHILSKQGLRMKKGKLICFFHFSPTLISRGRVCPKKESCGIGAPPLSTSPSIRELFFKEYNISGKLLPGRFIFSSL